MRFTQLAVQGAALIEIEPFVDERGSFGRAWCADELTAHDLDPTLAQMNLSTNVAAGTTRGLHFQPGEHAEAKFFRCLNGRTFHAMVDLRPGSPTYLASFGVELDAKSYAGCYIPAGCAAGYQALEDGAAILYTTSRRFHPGTELGVRWDDPRFGIAWPISDGVILSDKDRVWPDYQPEL